MDLRYVSNIQKHPMVAGIENLANHVYDCAHCMLCYVSNVVFLAHDSILNALYAIACPSICLSVLLSHGWINQDDERQW